MPTIDGLIRLDALRGVTRAQMRDDPLRAYAVVDGKMQQVPFRAGLVKRTPAASATTYAPVKQAAIDRAWTKAIERRAQDVQRIDVATAGAPVMVEDGGARLAAMHMSFGAPDQAREVLIEQMAAVGFVEQFGVVVRTRRDSAEYLGSLVDGDVKKNVATALVDEPGDIWTEDAGELVSGGGVVVPAPMPQGLDAPVEILRRRALRLGGKPPPKSLSVEALQEWVQKHVPDASFGVLGEVFARESQKGMVALALSRGEPVRVAFSSIEGGNMLVARDAQGRSSALVGRDSVDLTRAVLSHDLGGRVDDARIATAIAKDFGVEKTVFVEQPGDYHLDVRMTPIGDGVVLMDDATEALKLAAQWSREAHAKAEPKAPSSRGKEARAKYERELSHWNERGRDVERYVEWAQQHARRTAKGEARAAKDLEAQGFTVRRAPLVFPWMANLPPMNFVNVEQGRGPDGGRFWVSLGGAPVAEQHVAALLPTLVPELSRVYFLDRQASHTSLQAGGGVNCRCKPEVAAA